MIKVKVQTGHQNGERERDTVAVAKWAGLSILGTADFSTQLSLGFIENSL